MRNTILVATVLCAGVSALGCTSRDGRSAVEPKSQSAAAVQLDKAKADTKQAAQAMRDYAFAERAEFVAKMKGDLVSIQEDLDRLGAKADRASDAARADANARLVSVREKWVQTRKQLDRAESSTASDWDDVKNGFKQSYTDLRDSFNGARQWLSDKIAP